MGKLLIKQPGLFTTIQDPGRFGMAKYGVPVSGFMDTYAAKIANLHLGNSFEDAVMEITMQGPQLEFEGKTSICISGANLSVQLNGSEIEKNVAVAVTSGDQLKFGQRRSGCRAYLAILGGFEVKEVLGSKSWYDGITENYRLNKGQVLNYPEVSNDVKNKFASVKTKEDYIFENEIEVFPGPEFEKLSSSQKHMLFETEFTIDGSSNRMAYRFQEDFKNDLEAIPTGPVVPGTVQLTPAGNVIPLMKDCQVTGGYPRILQLSEKGIRIMAQKIPGEKIRFRRIDY